MPRKKGNGSIVWRDPAGIENAAPEQRLVAALIRQAVIDARSGDEAACRRLAHDLTEWLVWLVDDETDVCSSFTIESCATLAI